MLAPIGIFVRRDPWNKGKLVGQKAALKLRNIWAMDLPRFGGHFIVLVS
jgi:hypothetical protein